MKFLTFVFTCFMMAAPAIANEPEPRMFFPKFNLNLPDDAEVVTNLVQDIGEMRIQTLTAIFPFPKEHVAKMLGGAFTKFGLDAKMDTSKDALVYKFEGHQETPSHVQLRDYDGDQNRTKVMMMSITAAAAYDTPNSDTTTQ